MGFSIKTSHVRVLFSLLAILLAMSTLQVGVAKRPLHGEQWLKLQKVPVPTSGPSPCSHIPPPGKASICPSLNGMDFTGRHVNRAPPPPPSFPSSIPANSGGY